MGLKWVKFERIFIVCTPLLSAGAGGGGGGVEPSTKVSKRASLTGQDLRTSAFREGLLGKRGDFFQGGGGGCTFHTQKLKSEILNDKKSL